MKIVFLCPPVTTINGGLKYIFRMAQALIEQGRDVLVYEANGQRPAWFPTTAPITGDSAIFTRTADHIYVVPEDQPRWLADVATLPQRKVVYSQNHFYGAIGIGNARSYADYGVDTIICSSRTIYDHARIRHPTLKATIVPYAINRESFKPAAVKRNAIAYMPRKRPVEATYIRDMFLFAHPHYRDWAWYGIDKASEEETAAAMAEVKVFLSLSRLEGFGLTPLEAMASDCVVAGFTGIGGREYATRENGFWVPEDDFPAAVAALGAAVQMSLTTGATRDAYRAACQKSLTPFTPETFKQGVKDAWDAILGKG